MRPWLQLTAAIVALIAAPIIIALVIHLTAPNLFSAPSPAPRLDASDVKIIGSQSGHGSGVHIGNGYIITAAHVLEQEQDYTVKSASGQVWPATILWAAKAHDVALMRIEKPRMASSDLDCRPLVIDQPIRAKGNPWGLQFITMHGHVAGNVGPIANWQEAAVVDILIGNGMSGGPAFTGDKVVGINIGTIDRRAALGGIPFGYGVVPSGFGVIVPASAICKLLAR